MIVSHIASGHKAVSSKQRDGTGGTSNSQPNAKASDQARICEQTLACSVCKRSITDQFFKFVFCDRFDAEFLRFAEFAACICTDDDQIGLF